MKREAAVVIGVFTLISGCTGSQRVVLPEADFEDVTAVHQNTRSSIAPGWTWCDGLSPVYRMQAPERGTSLELGGEATVGATILDLSSRGIDADAQIDQFVSSADLCSTLVEVGQTISSIDAADSRVVAWRTRDSGGHWGEFAVMPLDDARVLAVGFVTDQEDPPADLDDLIRLAEQGARQVLGEEG